jgi:hypothetical protein
MLPLLVPRLMSVPVYKGSGVSPEQSIRGGTCIQGVGLEAGVTQIGYREAAGEGDW